VQPRVSASFDATSTYTPTSNSLAKPLLLHTSYSNAAHSKAMATQNNTKNALNESDIDQLSDLLDQLNETHACVSLEALDGVAAALAVMTRTVALNELGPVLLEQLDEAASQADLSCLNEPQLNTLDALIARRVNHTERLLSNSALSDLSDPRAYHPWVVDYAQLAADDPEVAAQQAAQGLPELGAEWAVGFISTVEYFEHDWRLGDDLLDDELNPMLAPIYALALPKDEWPEDIREQDVGGDTREAWLAQAIWACYELWEYWRHHAPKPKGVPMIKQSTPGRNDPCNCGSGKKYKQCCGA
jgi:uncharacterized protein